MILDIILSSSHCLSAFSIDALSRGLEPVRTARSAVSAFESGVSTNSLLWIQLCNSILSVQRNDGGWSDPEETAWVCSLLQRVYGADHPSFQSAMLWLNNARLASGGWGRHPRDRARIPITGLLAALLPELITPQDLSWLEAEWFKDFRGPVRLSYKGSFFLLAMAGSRQTELVLGTLKYLAADQNEDGGFGPWKGHPMGSDPWSTGVVLWGLSKWSDMVDKCVFSNATKWLASNQLPSGYWPYHYLDDGSALALMGLTSLLRHVDECVL